MLKVPGTQAGLAAIEELTRRGINVNVTLLFSIDRSEAVIDTYVRGLQAREDAHEQFNGIASVASFFSHALTRRSIRKRPAGLGGRPHGWSCGLWRDCASSRGPTQRRCVA